MLCRQEDPNWQSHLELIRKRNAVWLPTNSVRTNQDTRQTFHLVLHVLSGSCYMFCYAPVLFRFVLQGVMAVHNCFLLIMALCGHRCFACLITRTYHFWIFPCCTLLNTPPTLITQGEIYFLNSHRSRTSHAPF